MHCLTAIFHGHNSSEDYLLPVALASPHGILFADSDQFEFVFDSYNFLVVFLHK